MIRTRRLGFPLTFVILVAIALGIWRSRANGPKDQYSRGVSAYARGKWEESERVARSILRTDRADTNGLLLLARSSARLGRDAPAEAIYRRLGGDALEAEDLFLLGRGLLARGLDQPGAAALRSALDQAPDHAETLEALVAYSFRAGSLIDARTMATQLAFQKGYEVKARAWLGRVEMDLLEPALALDQISRAIDLDDALAGTCLTPSQARLLMARCALIMGEPARAILELDRVKPVARDPEAGEEKAWLASRAYLQQGDVARARETLAQAGVADDPTRPEPAPYLGALACRECHLAKYATQRSSRHARTLVRGADLVGLPWPTAPVIDADNPAIAQSFERDGGHVRLKTTIRDRAMVAIIEYALGSNHQGQTYIASDPTGQVRETRVSRFPRAPEWDRTIEHPRTPADDAGYAGRPISRESLRKCLGCHATTFQAAWDPQGRPEAADHGIGCERCHGPGGNHLIAVRSRFETLAIARPRLATAAQIMTLCGQCHQPPSSGQASVSDVRFQAPRLSRGRCYQESDGRLSCVTCHDPHSDAQTSADYYVSRCLECHPSAQARPRSTDQPTWPPCPVSPNSGCLACHMPVLKDAVPRSVFTDHWIRVRRPDEPRGRAGR